MLGYLAMSSAVSLMFVFLLIGTHFSDRTDFPAVDADGNLDRTWAEHNLATACDSAPESWWAHFFVGGVNAHAAHHLFPRVCHTHYRAIARIIIEVTDEYGVAYNRSSFTGMVRSHFAFLRQMGERPEEPAAAPSGHPTRGRPPGKPGGRVPERGQPPAIKRRWSSRATFSP